MTLWQGADASVPVAPLPQGFELVCGYIGEPGAGTPDTPHIWTKEEWNGYLEQVPSARFLPIYTHNYDNGQPEVDAANAVDAARSMGWAAFQQGLGRRLIWIDCEVLVDDAYFMAMQRRIFALGFQPGLYGSTWFVSQNTAMHGYWFANPTGRKPSSLTGNTLGVQWYWGQQWDYSVFSDEVWLAAGRGPRK